MKSGLLRHRVMLQTLSAGQDQIGQPVTAWIDTTPLWANVRYLNGLSAIKAGADTSAAKVSIRIRARAVDAGQRINQGGVIFSIESVLPDAKGEYVDLVCIALNVTS